MKISTAPIGAAIVAALAMSAAGLSAQQPGQQPQAQQMQAQQQPQTMTGEVVARTGDMVTIRTDAGETRIVVVDAQSRIMGPTGVLTAQPRQQRIDALRAGDRVTVQFRPGTTADQFVLVELGPAPGASGQAAAPRATTPAQPAPAAGGQAAAPRATTPGQAAPTAPGQATTNQTAQGPAAARLPQTAGQLPAVALLGLLSLIGAAGVGAATRSRSR